MRGVCAQSCSYRWLCCFPNVGKAQVYQFRDAAAGGDRRARGLADQRRAGRRPAGSSTTRRRVPFLRRAGDGADRRLSRACRVYADTTLEPFSIVYVPIGRDRLRAVRTPARRRARGHDGQPHAVVPGSERASEFGAVRCGRRATGRRSAPAGRTSVPHGTSLGAGTGAGCADRGRSTSTRRRSRSPRPSGGTTASGSSSTARGGTAHGPAVPFSADRFDAGWRVPRVPGLSGQDQATRTRSGSPSLQDGPLAPYAKR